MNRFTLKVRKWKLSLSNWQSRVSPKVQYWIDKYQLIKTGCVLGIAVNAYFIYDGLLTTIVLRQVHKQIQQKKQNFYQRVDQKRTMILALMQQLEKENVNLTQSVALPQSLVARVGK